MDHVTFFFFKEESPVALDRRRPLRDRFRLAPSRLDETENPLFMSLFYEMTGPFMYSTGLDGNLG